MINQIELWVIFSIIILGMFFLDLAIINRKSHIISLKEASLWSIGWIAVSLIFSVLIYFLLGQTKALEFLTGYAIEKSLSVDNIFVFIMIFSFFNVPAQYRPRVLKWGIIGAIIMRAILILVGINLFQTFHWIVYVFGVLLIFMAIKMMIHGKKELEPEKNLILGLFKRFFHTTPSYHKEKFFVLHRGIWVATPLFITLLLIESSDIIFAMDSIPAVIAITTDPFIVFTSNVSAIMGLRALFFVVEGMVETFRFLKVGISAILCFVGTKMIISDFYQINTAYSLGFVMLVLATSILASIIRRRGV